MSAQADLFILMFMASIMSFVVAYLLIGGGK